MATKLEPRYVIFNYKLQDLFRQINVVHEIGRGPPLFTYFLPVFSKLKIQFWTWKFWIYVCSSFTSFCVGAFKTANFKCWQGRRFESLSSLLVLTISLGSFPLDESIFQCLSKGERKVARRGKNLLGTFLPFFGRGHCLHWSFGRPFFCFHYLFLKFAFILFV